jgi:Tol biopolymer transport system component
MPTASWNWRANADSRDGRWMAYSCDGSGRYAIYVDSFPTPGQRVQISTEGGLLPRWRGDARALFFMSTKEGGLDAFYSVDVSPEPAGVLDQDATATIQSV